MLVDHTDSGDGLAPDKYVCQARNIVPGKKCCCHAIHVVAWNNILFPGKKYCWLITRTVETDWHLIDIVAWKEILFPERNIVPGKKCCCLERNIVARQDILLVDQLDSGDGMAPDNYYFLEILLSCMKYFWQQQTILFSGKKNCCHFKAIAKRAMD